MDYVALMLGKGDVATTLVAEARNASRHDVCVNVSPADSLFSLAELFSRGVHRACVLSAEGALVGVVSQSDLLAFVASHLPSEPSMLDQTLEQAHLVHAAGHVKTEQPLRAALVLMNEMGHEAVAVTGAGEELVGAVSVEALRGVGPEQLQRRLERSAGEFADEHKDRIVRSMPGATVRETVATVVAARAHQVWIEEGGKLKAVVTLSDLVRFAMKSVATHHHKK